jgi:hypothetical protein
VAALELAGADGGCALAGAVEDEPLELGCDETEPLSSALVCSGDGRRPSGST